jgi:hypothetical protein
MDLQEERMSAARRTATRRIGILHERIPILGSDSRDGMAGLVDFILLNIIITN